MKKMILLKKLLTAAIAGMMAVTPAAAFAGADSAVTGEITVSCYDSMVYKSFLEYAAITFEEKYPGTKVNIDAFSAMPEIRTVTTEDESGMVTVTQHIGNSIDPKAESGYVARVNTEMISGGGADIYAVDVLPYYKYADSGMFEDLRRFMDSDSDFDYEDYHKNIFDAAMYKGGQYILPLDYEFSCLSYDKTIMEPEAGAEIEFGRYTFERLMELGFDSFVSRYDPGAEDPIRLIDWYTGYTEPSFYNDMLKLNYSSFVDIENKKANFTDGRFAQILNKAKEYEEMGYIDARPNLFAGYLYETGKSLLRMLSADDLVKHDIDAVYLNFYGLSGAKDDVLIGLLAGDNGESSFITTQAYAISGNSKNKETAWAFLKFLLGDEMQGLTGLRYNPVNKNAAAEKAKFKLYSLYSAAGIWKEDLINFVPVAGNISEETGNYEGEALLSFSEGYDIKFNEVQQKIYETYMDYTERYTALINAYTIRDAAIDAIIEAEVKKFFEGSHTADEVALTLQNKVNIYLQE